MERGMNGMAGSPPESVVEGVERAAVGPPGPISPDDPKPGETWRHYKGRDYEIVAVGLFEDDRTPMVVYRCPKSGQAKVRTLANFTEVVPVDAAVRVKVTEEHPSGEPGFRVPYRRFSRVGRPKDDVSPNGKPPGTMTKAEFWDAARFGPVNGIDLFAESPGIDIAAEVARKDESDRRDRMRFTFDKVIELLDRNGIRVDSYASVYDCVEELIGRVRANEAVSHVGKPPTGYPPGWIDEQKSRCEMEADNQAMGAALDEIRAISRDVAGVDNGSVVESVKTIAYRARQWAEGSSILGSHVYASQPGKPPGWDGYDVARLAANLKAARGDVRMVRDLFARGEEGWIRCHKIAVRLGAMTRRIEEFGVVGPDEDSQDGKPPVPGSLESMREAWMALQLVIARLETATHYLATPESVLLEILEGTDDVKRHLDAAMGDVEDAAGIAPDEAPH